MMQQAFKNIAKDNRAKHAVMSYVYKKLPELENLKVTTPQHMGNTDYVFLLGDKLAIKILKNNTPEHIKAFKQEYTNQKTLEEHPFVAKIEHADISLKNEFNFYVMRQTQGIALTQVIKQQNPAEQTRTAKQLAEFCDYIQKKLPAKDRPDDGLYDILKHTKPFNEENTFIKGHIKQLLGTERFDAYTEVLDAFEEIHQKSEPVSFNTDLNPGNIFMDKKDKGKIVGALDFSTIKQCKIPEIDFALQSLGKNIHSEFSREFSKFRSFTNGYDVLKTYATYTNISKIIYSATHSSQPVPKDILQKTDKQVAQCKLPTPT